MDGISPFFVAFIPSIQQLLIYIHVFLFSSDFSSLPTIESIDDSSSVRESNSASHRHHRRGHPARRKPHSNELRRVVRIEYQKDTWDVASSGITAKARFIVLILTFVSFKLFT